MCNTEPTIEALNSINGRDISISVFFPCHNEQDNLPRLIEQTKNVLDELGADYEIIIVDDGSTDNTAKLADEYAAGDSRIKAVHHEVNLGYGRALITGIKAAVKELIFYTDGDCQFDVKEMPPLLPLMKSCDIVSCYRINRQDNLIRKINGFCWTKLVCLLFGLKLRDIDCAFKIYKRSIFEGMPLSSTGALIDTEILARAARKGCKIIQRPVHHYKRQVGVQSGSNIKVIYRAFKELFELRKKIIKGQ